MPQESFNRSFCAVPDEKRIPIDKKDHVMKEIAKLEGVLKELFPMPCQYGKCEVGEYSGLTIINRLIDTNQTRIGASPEGLAKSKLVEQANLAIEKDCPLMLVGIYGTPRHLDHPNLNYAQLADLSAVMMIQGALDRIHSAHLKGAEYHIIDENLSALWLDIAQHPSGEKGKDNFNATYKTYFDDRMRLLKTLEKEGLINTGNTKIELLSEADIYGSNWKKEGSLYVPPSFSSEDNFLATCERLRTEILNYLTISGAIFKKNYGEDDRQWISSEENIELWEKCKKMIVETNEYLLLKDAGWQGLIPPEMRKYYLEKFRTILGNANLKADDPMLLFHVATYLSSTLAKHKAGTLTGGIPVGTPIIKVPLVRPVDGRPSAFQSLIPQRTLPKVKGSMDKKVSNTNRAAWLSLAVQGDDKLRLIDTTKFTEIPEELIVPVQIYIVGPDNSAGSYLVDTAILLSDS